MNSGTPNIMDELEAYIPDNYPAAASGNPATNAFLLQAATSVNGGMGMSSPGGGGTYNNAAFPHQYPMEHIDYPGMNDVMCGRGGGTNNHIGNIRFRQLVNEHKRRYLAASKVDKPRVALEVVQIWRELDPPGRFLTKTDLSQGDDSLWHDVGDKKAREKASQCLRERTPDVIPFVKKLQEKEKEEKEKKLKQKNDGTSGSDRSSSHRSKEKKGDSTDKPDNTTSSSSKGKSPDGEVSSSSNDPSSPLSKQQKEEEHSNNNDPQDSQSRRRRTKKKTKEEIANSIPTAAALMNDVFSEDDDSHDDNDSHQDDEDEEDVLQDLDMESYQRSVEEYLDTAPKGDSGVDGYSVTDRSMLMETMSTSSWVKSFKSVDTSSVSSAAMIMSASSLRDVLENNERSTVGGGSGDGDGDDGIDGKKGAAGGIAGRGGTRPSDISSSKGTLPTTNIYRPAKKKQDPLTKKLNSFKSDNPSKKLSSFKSDSQMSMISDLTDMSSRKSSNRSTSNHTAAQQQAVAIANAELARDRSKRSMPSSEMRSLHSEMTELSDEIKSMDLSSGT